MLACVGLFAFIWFIYGMIKPDGALPDAVGPPSRGKVVLGYGGWLLVSLIWSAVSPTPPVSEAEREEAAADSVAELRHDSLTTAYSLALAGGDYLEAEQGADSLAAELPPDHEDADTLRAIAARAEEQRLYAAAQALPGSQLQENATAYRDLATRYPDNPLYRQKANDYDSRIQAAATRRARRSVARAPRTSGGSCGPAGRTIYQGPRGGCYYLTSGGNKEYVGRGCC